MIAYSFSIAKYLASSRPCLGEPSNWNWIHFIQFAMDLMEEDSVVWELDDIIVWIYRNKPALARHLKATHQQLKLLFESPPAHLHSLLEEANNLESECVSFCAMFMHQIYVAKLFVICQIGLCKYRQLSCFAKIRC